MADRPPPPDREPDPPRRIVCLTEETTEILYALGEGDRVVGISAWTERPPEARRDKPVVSGFTGGSVERIAALCPDLVLGFSDVQADLAQRLVRAHLSVWITNQRTIAEILDLVRLLGRLVGREARARELVEGYQTRIRDARSRAAARPRRPRVYFEEWMDPLLCGSAWVSELIEAAGGEDVFRERAPSCAASGRVVTPGEVVARRPDVILASWCGKPFDPEAVRARPGFADLPAVRTGRVHEIPASVILQPGPAALTDGLDRLEALLA